MKNVICQKQKVSMLVLCAGISQLSLADSGTAGSFTEALMGGDVSADFRMRYENVDQDNALQNADALTLRSRLAYTTDVFSGLSAMMEVEDVRIVGGVDDYSVGPSGFNPGRYSGIADPETTEVDQAFIQYRNGDFTGKLGRQVIVYNNQRFIGDVGWRQDRQTFDALSLRYRPVENITLHYNYIDQRNRIFAEDSDIDSDDHLFNISWESGMGTLAGYAYLLEDTDTGAEYDTYGMRLEGTRAVSSIKLLYTADFAHQTFDLNGFDAKANYYNLTGGIVINGFTLGAGYEVLGSDNASYGFATPLATLHAHNGWADQFLNTPSEGLVDLSFEVGSRLAGGNLKVVYHDFEADDGSPGVDDLGNEVDIVYSRNFAEHYNLGIKYARYSAGDINVDTDKLWMWVGVRF